VRPVPAGERAPQYARVEADTALDRLQADLDRLLGVAPDQPTPSAARH